MPVAGPCLASQLQPRAVHRRARGETQWATTRTGRAGDSEASTTEPLAWAIAANIAEEAGAAAQDGRGRFAPGAKVWLSPWGWSFEGRASVIGRHRGTARYIRMVMPYRRLTNFRARGIYSYAVLRKLTHLRPCQSRPEAERAAAFLTYANAHPSFRSNRRSEVMRALSMLTKVGSADPRRDDHLRLNLLALLGKLGWDKPEPVLDVGILYDEREAAAVDTVLGPLLAVLRDVDVDQLGSHPRWPEVATAANAAYELLDDPILRLIDTDGDIRRRAARALGAAGGPSALPALKRMAAVDAHRRETGERNRDVAAAAIAEILRRCGVGAADTPSP